MVALGDPVKNLTFQRYYTLTLLHSASKWTESLGQMSGFPIVKGQRIHIEKKSTAFADVEFGLLSIDPSVYIRSSDIASDSSIGGNRCAVDYCEFQIRVSPNGYIRGFATPFSLLTKEIVSSLVNKKILRRFSFCRLKMQDVVSNVRDSRSSSPAIVVPKIQGHLPADDKVSAVAISGTDALSSSVYDMLEDKFGPIPIKPSNMILRFSEGKSVVSMQASSGGQYMFWMQNGGSCLGALSRLLLLLYKEDLFEITKDFPRISGFGEGETR